MDPTPPYRAAPENHSSSRGVAFSVGVLTFINLFNYLDRYVLPAVIPSIDRELHFGLGRMGTLGSAFVVVYMLASPIFGRLGDTRSRRGLVAVGIALWSIASAATGLAHTYVALLAARAAVGVGEAAYATIAPSILSDYYPPERRGRVMTIFFAAIPVGCALGYILGGLLSHHLGWRYAFLCTGLPGLALAVMAAMMREPKRGAFDPPQEKATVPLREALGILRTSREYVWAVAGYTALTFGLGGLSYWMPTYLHNVRGMSELKASSVVGTLTVIGGLLGTLVGGVLGEQLRTRVRGPYFVVCGWSSIAGAICAVAMFYTPSILRMEVLLFLSVFLVFLPNGPVNTMLVNAVPPSVRATAMAMSIFCIHFFGDAGSPALIGYMADAVGLQNAVLLVPSTIALGGILWLIGRSRAFPSRESA